MNAQITVKTEYSEEITNIENIDNIDHLEYIDQDNAKNIVNIFDNGIEILRIGKDHNTKAVFKINDESCIEIQSCEGLIKIFTKTLAFMKNNDNITLVYITQDSSEGSIKIKYIGV